MTTKYPSVLENEYIEQLHQMMKPAAFWKYAAFGIVCIRQELEIYRGIQKKYGKLFCIESVRIENSMSCTEPWWMLRPTPVSDWLENEE
ncbi:MAG: hypothetical protein IKM28_03640 [Lachnospiraceae bacterium]|nr:hypothetical protein [Lachnospiraceae bacterium]